MFHVRLGDDVALLVLGDRHQPVHLVHGLSIHAHGFRDGVVGVVAHADAAHVGAHGREFLQHRGDPVGVAGGEELSEVFHRDAQRIDGAKEVAGILAVVPLVA